MMDGPTLPLLVRGLLLAAGVAVVAYLFGPATALGPGLALLVVTALGAIPLPPRTRLVQAFAELTVLALVIGSLGDVGLVFVPLLLLPVLATGQRGGLALGATGGVVATMAWVLAILSSTRPSLLDERLLEPAVWITLLVAAGLIGGWIRRLTTQETTYSDTAYEEAFRLLSELQQVARNLSLGLDPATLASGLLDDVAAVAPGRRRTLLARTGQGPLAPLAGDSRPDQHTDDPGSGSTGSRTGRAAAVLDQHHSFPVKMGERVVAVLELDGPTLPAEEAAHVERMVGDVGPKLAAALVFDDVRQLATVDERLRLAREIHDGIAQELASVGYMLDDLASRVEPGAATELQDLREHVRRVTGELRLSIFDLRAGVDDSIGLGTALSEHVQRVGQQSELVVHTVLDEHGDRLPVGTEVELLRIAQEAVTNVRKHAQASNLWVECTVDAPRAWVRIADDGVGLQPARPQSMGLRGMRERARRIGGDLQITERPGGGTVVEVSVGDLDDEDEDEGHDGPA